MTQVEVRPLDADEFADRIGELVRIYADAMRPPRYQLADRRSLMRLHAGYPDFRCVVAVADDALVGFGYAFPGHSGQWWHDIVTASLVAKLGTRTAASWVDDSYEIAELHVLPRHQAKGVGRALITDLCADRSERTALLSTRDAPTRARRFYASLGFTDLLSDYRFPGSDVAYAVMGAPLPLPASAGRPSPSR